MNGAAEPQRTLANKSSCLADKRPLHHRMIGCGSRSDYNKDNLGGSS